MPPSFTRMLALGIALAALHAPPALAQTGPDSATEQNAPRLTSELDAATLIVELPADGGVVTGIGMVLKPSSFHPPVDGGAMARLAAVHFEIAAGAPAPRVGAAATIRRLRAGNTGSRRDLARRGTLVTYDPASQTGLVRFGDIFPYRLDGSILPGTGPVAAALSISGDVLELRPATASGPGVQFTDAGPGTSSCVCLDAHGSLAGFGVRQTDGAWRFSAYQLPQIDTTPPSFVPAFDPAAPAPPGLVHEYGVPARLPGRVNDPLVMVKGFHVLHRDAGQSGTPPATSSESWQVSQPPIPDASSEQASYREGAIQFSLPNLGARPEKTERNLELQLIAKNHRDEVIYASPVFGAVIERKGAATYARLRGLPQGSAGPASAPASATMDVAGARPQAAPAAGAVEITSESPLEFGFPVLGGTEVLFKASQAPHWKRLSLKDRRWIDFPRTLDLAKLEMAGNREALFTLNRDTREIQRLNPTTMEKQAAHVLPEGREYFALAAGATSAGAPIAVITSMGVMAVSPDTLKPLGTGVLGKARFSNLTRGVHCQSSGDGCSLHVRTAGSTSSFTDEDRFTYQGPTLGFVAEERSQPRLVATSSHALRWGRDPDSFQLPGSTSEEKPGPPEVPNRRGWATPFSTTLLYLAVRADPRSSPGAQTTYTGHVCSPYARTPLWSFPIPEAEQMDNIRYRSFFDPESLTLAVWSHASGVTLRTLDRRTVKLESPVLLNSPEPVAQAGSSCVFTPKVLGPPGWKLSVTGGLADLKVDDQGTLRWVATSAVGQANQTLKVQLTAAAGAPAPSGTTEMSFPLLVEATHAPVTAITATLSVRDAVGMINRTVPAATMPVPTVAIASRLVRSEKRIRDVLPGLNDYVLVRMEDGSLELRSPEDGKVFGNYAPPNSVLVLPAGDCLFTFDSIRQTINRIELPSMNVVKTAPVPGSGSLLGLGSGKTPEGPLSLVISGQSLKSGLPTEGKLAPNVLALLDRQTLAPGPWAAFGPPPMAPRKPGTSDPILPMLHLTGAEIEVSFGKLPATIPTSRDGRTLFLSSSQLIVSPSLTTGIPGQISGVGSPAAGWRTLATPAGDRLSHDGTLQVGKSRSKVPSSDCEFSPCGLYYVRHAPEAGSAEITLYSSDGMRPMFHITNIDVYRLPDGLTGNLARRVVPLGDKNLIIAIHKLGHDMQFIKVDVPATYRQTNPQTAIVTSRISPFVAEGRTMQYQLATNNPAAVSGFKLRQPVAGASLSREGLFNYRAPAQIPEPLAVQVIVEVVLQSGAVVEHEFPIWVLPLPSALRKGI